MRIHLITNLFAPDELAGASLYTDMASYLHDHGHDVRVTTTFSYYPAWALRPEDAGVAQRDETHHGVPVHRIRMYIPRKVGGMTRLLSDLSFLFSLLRRGLFPDGACRVSSSCRTSWSMPHWNWASSSCR
jgi:colanic acid biosynthesis glycosyl transferase WcaI